VTIERIRTFEDLAVWLDESKQRFRVDATTRTAEVTIQRPRPLSGTLQMRWDAGSPYVLLDFPFVLDVPESRIRAVETAIVRANNIIALPGLGFDYVRRNVHMHVAVPMHDDGMLATSFKAQVFGVLSVANDFLGAFQAIVAGQPGEQVMELAVEAAKARGGAEA